MKNKDNIFAIILVVLVLAAGAWYAVTQSKPAAKTANSKEKITVGYLGTVPNYNLLLDTAQAQGYFSDQNLDVVRKPVDSKVSTLLDSGAADVTIQFVSSTLLSYANNNNLRLVGTLSNYPSSNYLVSHYPRASFNQVRKIGVSSIGGAEQINFARLADTLGLDKSKIIYVNAPTVQVKAAMLQSGAIDMAFLQGSSIAAFRGDSRFVILSPSVVFKGVVLPEGVVTNVASLNQKNDEITKFLTAINRSEAYIKANKATVVKQLKDKYQLTDVNAANMYQEIISSMTTLTPSVSQLKDSWAAILVVAPPKNAGQDLSGFVVTGPANAAK